METLKKHVELGEVLTCYERENQGSASFEYGRSLLAHAGGGWTLVRLSKEDILTIMLPHHRHPAKNPNVVVIPESGMAVVVAGGRVKEMTGETGPCWENIISHKERDFSQLHIFLLYSNGALMNLDGLHRLLAWVVFEKTQQIPAYVAGRLGTDGP